jgi:hypothetical protein
MADCSEIQLRAAKELCAAARALRHANALFDVLQGAIVDGEANQIDALSIAEIGSELTAAYGERACGEADHQAKAGVPNV